jgi:SAM-dependent methyltransferase
MDHEPPYTPEQHARRASSFGSQAAAYATSRPTYPAELIEWGLEPIRDRSAPRVLDLAAGTGKLTEGLLAQGVDVVAVEPDPAMSAELTSRFPQVTVRQGTAERIPLADASVDAVFVGQALHWFDMTAAVPEIRRVLRPGGPLVPVWNAHDDRVPWVAELCAITGTVAWSANEQEATKPPGELLALGPVATKVVEHREHKTVDSLVNTVATHSHLLTATPERRAEVLARLRGFLVATPETSGPEFDLPLVGFGMRVVPE